MRTEAEIRNDRVHLYIVALRKDALDEGQQLAVNKLEKTMLRAAPVTDQGRKEHSCGLFVCCLRHLVNDVTEGMRDGADVMGIKPEALEAAYELLFIQLEEAWDPLDGDIVAPELQL